MEETAPATRRRGRPLEHRGDGHGRAAAQLRRDVDALRVLMDPDGFGVPPRKLTLSTVGILPALEKLMREPVRPNLAISLHAPNPALRRALMPIEEKYPFDDVVEAALRYPIPRGGRRDLRVRAARRRQRLAGARARAGAPAAAAGAVKVNLIPLNPAPEIPFEAPQPEAVEAFCAIARRAPTSPSRCAVRAGQDILAACGQLHLKQGAGDAAPRPRPDRPPPSRPADPLRRTPRCCSAAALAAAALAAASARRRSSARRSTSSTAARVDGRERRLAGPVLPGRAVLRQADPDLLADGRGHAGPSASPRRGGAPGARCWPRSASCSRRAWLGTLALRPPQRRSRAPRARHDARLRRLRRAWRCPTCCSRSGTTLAVALAVRAYRDAAGACSSCRSSAPSSGLGFLTKGPSRSCIPGLAILLLLVRCEPRPAAARRGLAGCSRRRRSLRRARPRLVRRSSTCASGRDPLVYFFLRENLQRFAAETYDVGRPPGSSARPYLAEGLPWSLFLPLALARLLGSVRARRAAARALPRGVGRPHARSRSASRAARSTTTCCRSTRRSRC